MLTAKARHENIPTENAATMRLSAQLARAELITLCKSHMLLVAIVKARDENIHGEKATTIRLSAQFVLEQASSILARFPVLTRWTSMLEQPK